MGYASFTVLEITDSGAVPTAVAHVRLADSARGLDPIAARSVRLWTNDLGV
jgi:hypothetical protein